MNWIVSDDKKRKKFFAFFSECSSIHSHHFGEEPRDVDTQSHVGNHLFDDIALALRISFGSKASQEVAQFVDFTFARFCKIRIGNIRNARSSVGTSGVGNATTGWIGRCHCPDCELLVVVLL